MHSWWWLAVWPFAAWVGAAMAIRRNRRIRTVESELESAAWDVAVNDQLRQSVCAWLVSNAIEPAAIPADPEVMSLADGRLTVSLMVRRMGSRGLVPTVDPDNPNRIATTTATFPIGKPPPADVAEWLRRRTQTCGR